MSNPMVRRFLFPACSMLLGSAIAFGAPSTAFAQPAAPPPKAITDEADRLFREGNEAFRAEKWEEAIVLYERAFAMKKTHDIATNLAYAEMKLGYNARAARYLNFAVKNSPPTGDAERRRIAVERLAGLKAKLAMLTIDVNVAGAQILIDGKPVGTSPLNEEVFADPGKVKIEAKREGYTPAQQVVQAEKGAALQVKLTLVAKPEEVRGPAVSSITGGTTNDKPSSQGAATAKGAENGGGAATGSSSQSTGDTTRADRYRLPIIITGAATTAALLGTGVGFTIIANRSASDAASLRQPVEQQAGQNACHMPGQSTQVCEDIRAAGETLRQSKNAAFFTFFAGGVIGAGTLVYAIVTHKPKRASALQVSPWAGAGNGGLVVAGQW